MKNGSFAAVLLAAATAGVVAAQPPPGGPAGGDSQGQFQRQPPPMGPNGAKPGMAGDPFQAGGRSRQGFRSPRGEAGSQQPEVMPRFGMPQGEGMRMRGMGPSPETMRPDGGPLPRTPFGDGLFPPELVMQNQKTLALTDEQTSAIRSEFRASVNRFMDLQWQQSADEEALSALLKEDRLDENKVGAALEKLMSVENTIKRDRLSLLVRVRNTLTAEQRAKLQQLSAKQMPRREDLSPQGLPGMPPGAGEMPRQPGPPREGEQPGQPGQPGQPEPTEQPGRPVSSAVIGQVGE